MRRDEIPRDGTPLVVLAGKEYGSGSSRDWAAKGPYLLGIKAVIAESFERIHRSNLIGMGILPLEYLDGATRTRTGSPARRSSTSPASRAASSRACTRRQRHRPGAGRSLDFKVRVRIDTPDEAEYYRHGGILQYVLRHLRANA